MGKASQWVWETAENNIILSKNVYMALHHFFQTSPSPHLHTRFHRLHQRLNWSMEMARIIETSRSIKPAR